MARYLGSRCKKCRALGFSVCGSDRCALFRRSNPPGMHPDLRRKLSDFKKRLIEVGRLRSYSISNFQLSQKSVKTLSSPDSTPVANFLPSLFRISASRSASARSARFTLKYLIWVGVICN